MTSKMEHDGKLIIQDGDDMDQDGDEADESPCQLPGQKKSRLRSAGLARSATGHEAHPLDGEGSAPVSARVHQEPQARSPMKRRRLMQAGSASKPAGLSSGTLQQQCTASIADDMGLEDDFGEFRAQEGAYGAFNVHQHDKQGRAPAGGAHNRHSIDSTPQHGQPHPCHKAVKERDKWGHIEEGPGQGKQQGKRKPGSQSTRHSARACSSPEWSGGSESEAEQGEDEEEEEGGPVEAHGKKRGRNAGQGGTRAGSGRISKRGRGPAPNIKANTSSPLAMKAPLQLTLSQFVKPQTLLQPSGSQPCSKGVQDSEHDSQQQQQQQQQRLSQPSQPPSSPPLRAPLLLSRSSQPLPPLHQQQLQPLLAGSAADHHMRRQPQGLVLPGSGTVHRSAGLLAATKHGRASPAPPCPSSAPAAAVKCEEGGALWSDKHAPNSSGDLAVHKKKVEEVRDFLRQQRAGHAPWGSRMLIASGPTGCGKSTTVRLLAAELGFQVVEYTPPTPTLWSELQHQNDPGIPKSMGSSYVSKLDDFEAFVARAKYPALPLAFRGGGAATQGLSSNKLLLIDDLPHVHDAERSRRLAACLADLAATARGPVVLICTANSGGSGGSREGGGSIATGGPKGLSKDVMSALDSAGATLLNFNPITANNITKVLQQVAASEGCPLSPDAAASIAALADGDVRNAIQTLQVMFAGRHAKQGDAKLGRGKGARGGGKASGGRGSRSKAAKVGTVGGGLVGSEAARIASAQRDLGLDIFHALGKLLYNKRKTVEEDGGGELQGQAAAGVTGKRGMSKAAEAAAAAVAVVRRQAAEQNPSCAPWMPRLECSEDWLCESLRRPPSNYDPEAIVTQSGLEPIQIASFLHENYLNFIAEDAIEDVALAASYMSDGVFMASARIVAGSSEYSGGFWGLEEPSTATNLAAACAGSVVARGLMFANTHPAPRRWTPLQAPAQGRMERARADNAERVLAASACLAARHGTLAAGGCAAAVSAQILPWLRSLAFFPDYFALAHVLPSMWTVFSMTANQNSLAQVHGCKAQGPGTCARAVPQQGCVQQLEWVQEQEGEFGGEAGTEGGTGGGDMDPIED